MIAYELLAAKTRAVKILKEQIQRKEDQLRKIEAAIARCRIDNNPQRDEEGYLLCPWCRARAMTYGSPGYTNPQFFCWDGHEWQVSAKEGDRVVHHLDDDRAHYWKRESRSWEPYFINAEHTCELPPPPEERVERARAEGSRWAWLEID